MTRKAKKGAPEKEYHSEFMSLYDLLTSIDKHLSSIEGSVSVIRKTAEDTNTRVEEREKVQGLHGKVS